MSSDLSLNDLIQFRIADRQVVFTSICCAADLSCDGKVDSGLIRSGSTELVCNQSSLLLKVLFQKNSECRSKYSDGKQNGLLISSIQYPILGSQAWHGDNQIKFSVCQYPASSFQPYQFLFRFKCHHLKPSYITSKYPYQFQELAYDLFFVIQITFSKSQECDSLMCS